MLQKLIQRGIKRILLTFVFLPLLLAARVAPATGEGRAPRYQAGFPLTELHAVDFSSPSVVDINGDGRQEILLGDGAGCVWGWNHRGERLPNLPWPTVGSCKGSARINTPLAIGDIDGDGKMEIAAGTRGSSAQPGERGQTFIWKADGSLLPGWPQEMDWNFLSAEGAPEIYSVILANIVGDERLEVVAGTSNNSSRLDVPGTAVAPNIYAWEMDGTLLPGYPTWYKTAGVYGAIGAADLTGDGYAEVITGRDHLYLHAYDAQGRQLPGWPVQTYVDPARNTWGRDLYMEFTNNAPAMGDLDGDGTIEIVIAGKVKDPTRGYTAVHSGVLVVEPDGKRRAGWRVAKLGGPPLHYGYPPRQAPALADVDGDGKLEIIITLFDGTVRAYRENGELLWQHDYAQRHTLFASSPVVGEVTGDGRMDVIFGLYNPDGTAHHATGLYGVDARSGQPLPNFPIPLTHEGARTVQGIRATPTIADVDEDGDVEILAASRSGVLYVWDMPAKYVPSCTPWPRARKNHLRTGAFSPSPSEAAGAAATMVLPPSHRLFLPISTRSCTD